MVLNLIFISLIYFSNYQFVENFDCYHEWTPHRRAKIQGLESTDFSMVYKLPDNILSTGYFYKTYRVNSNDNYNDLYRFQFSKRHLFESNSIIQLTLEQLSKVENLPSLSYIAYSGIERSNFYREWKLSPKTTKKRKIGNTGKGSGYLVWNVNKKSAIWIMYSDKHMHKHMNEATSSKPIHSYTKKGMIFLCLRIHYNDLTTILKHLVIRKSRIYSHHLADPDADNKILDDAKNSIYPNPKSIDPKNLKMDLKSIQENQISSLKTVNDLDYIIITYSFKDKGGIWNKVAKELDCKKIYIKTHKKKASSSLQLNIGKPNCKNRLIDIENITMKKIVDSKEIPITWNYREDTSKYGICEGENNQNYICISDMDRNLESFREAGSVVCFSHVHLYQSFKSIAFDYNCIESKKI